MTPASSEDGHCAGEVCLTCSDAAVVVRVVRLLGDDLALVDTGTGHEEVSVALVDPACLEPGAHLLVHAKEAIGVPR
ncbi:hydrogenase assembly protein HupF [Saccharomonospora xinjiangensis]|uniref:HupF/HypC family protein n=1 Tax=Saccharomonospora xinjiangensis XJ-54 TaxID=882086 RepID=I0UZZ3_9PSEU|nr:hydrogenase assembly protein HupF [Saccharomonospora xinjiangensis]EID53446.1 HupF/HypC family protein [Saccharomonospora xinjiangensis XJ-54]